MPADLQMLGLADAGQFQHVRRLHRAGGEDHLAAAARLAASAPCCV